MDRIRAISAFVQAADLGSFSAAAKVLRTTQPNVSKLIAALERSLGGRLLERTTRPLALTEQGRRFLDRAREILRAIDAATAEFSSSRQAVAGSLRIAASPGFGRSQIVPALPALLARHTGLNVELCFSDRSVDLAREGIDLAFRVGTLRDSDLVARRVGMAPRLIVAAPQYLARHGRPHRPQDLADHQCIHFAGIGAPRIWRLVQRGSSVTVPVKGRVQADTSDGVREAAVQGLGIAVLPAWVLRQDLASGRLEAILSSSRPAPLPVQAVMLRSAIGSGKVKAAVEHFTAHFRKTFRQSA